ncbi:MAG: hypothetical protein QXL01_04740 [Thermoplasmatales archaeon]
MELMHVTIKDDKGADLTVSLTPLELEAALAVGVSHLLATGAMHLIDSGEDEEPASFVQ